MPMPFDPDEKPREFLIILLAALRFACRDDQPSICFRQAENFVEEVERRYGKIEP